MIFDAHQLKVAREKLRRENRRHASVVAAIESEIRECESRCRHKYEVIMVPTDGVPTRSITCKVCGRTW